MNDAPEQLALDLDLPRRLAMGYDDFLRAPCNAEALAFIENWRDWPGRRLCLVGPQGSGKTHLVHVWMEAAQAQRFEARDLLALGPQSLATAQRAALEGAENALGNAAFEQALFHLYNLMDQTGGVLLLTGRTPPARWLAQLPDLASRLGSVAVARMEEPDEALLGALLLKHMQERGLKADARIAPFLARRIERSHEAAAQMADLLDNLALRRGRAADMALAREALEAMNAA